MIANSHNSCPFMRSSILDEWIVDLICLQW